MIQTINKMEKIKLFYSAKQKADNDLVLYFHFLTIKEKWYKKIKETK